ncbi:MAG TPA: hypothetical protein H9931_11230 [Candidatus Enterocloster excrementigallinarum]|uniref:AP2/ERF domain-containing protein n=1 Tax=Candidatus Enterocloster excrementigallinarum TaxID=2838558 RepID=A0A9D2PW07_9FIRM|nr:hypothetical protein [Candidatus Enterocloster excrementigallinarum]
MKEDLTGKTFGRLTAIRPVRKEGNRKKFWLCSCSCGAEKIVEQSHLKSGHTQSCGCYRREAPRKRQQDLTGRRCGKLLVLEPAAEEDGSVRKWECLCDCGKRVICSGEGLLSGKTKSCGCLPAQVRRENVKKALHFEDGTCIERIASRRNCANNTTGRRGVYRKRNNRWRAAIGFQGKVYYLGTFDRYEDAVKAREEAEQKLYDSFLERYRKGQTEPED